MIIDRVGFYEDSKLIFCYYSDTCFDEFRFI